MVVAHQQQRAAELRECPFERLDRVQVEVVGGLVHDDERGRVQQAAGNHQFSQLARAGGSAFQDSVGIGVQLRHAAENASAVDGGEAADVPQDALALLGARFLGYVEDRKPSASFGAIAREQLAYVVEKCGFACAVVSYDADVLGVSHKDLG